MFLELVNDLFLNSSVFYVYFGIFLLTLGINQLGVMQSFNWQNRAQVFIKEQRRIKIAPFHMIEMKTIDEVFMTWFVKSFKRIDTVDDDEADGSNSYLNAMLKIRGGRIWKTNKYPLPFGRLFLA